MSDENNFTKSSWDISDWKNWICSICTEKRTGSVEIKATLAEIKVFPKHIPFPCRNCGEPIDGCCRPEKCVRCGNPTREPLNNVSS